MDRARAAESHLITLDDGRVLHLQEWAGEGRPLVLLPGMFDSSAGWTDLAVASRRRCIAIDLPGFGRSSSPRRPRLSAYAEDVVEGLSRVGVRSFTLVGHSLGGGVATAVAELVPSGVAALVLCAPVGFGRIAIAELGALPFLRELTAAVAPYVLSNPVLLRLVYAELVTNGLAPTQELRTRLAQGARGVGPGARAAVEAIAVAGRSAHAFHRRSVRYHGPVAALWGARDGIVSPTHTRGVLTALPQAQIKVWPGMGHHPQRERPRELEQFVAKAHEVGVGRKPTVAFGMPRTRAA